MIDTAISADDASAMRNRGQLPAGEPAINSPFLSGKQVAGLALMLTLCHAVPGQSAAHDKNKVFRFNIPAGSMASALMAFSETTDTQLSYPSVLVRDVKANALNGRYTPEQALAKLLSNSNITYRIADNQVIALAQAPKENSPGNSVPEKSVELAVMTVKADSLAPDDISPYITSESTAGSKIPVETTRIPQSIQVITGEALKDQGALSIGNILKQVPSATVIGTRFSRFPKISIRGFKADQNRNGIRQIFGGDVDWSALSHIENVEVLKGPGSTVYGQQTNDGGGVINVVTKRPFDEFASEFSFTRGGYDEFDGDITSGQWDLNGPLLADGALKARFTGEIEGSESFINFQNLDRENFGLALAWDDGGPVRGFINAEYQHRSTVPNPGLPVFGTVRGSGFGNISRDTYLGEPNFDNLEIETPLVQAWLDIDVGENWKISPRFQYDEFNGDQDQVFLGQTTLDAAAGRINVARTGRTGFKERDRSYIGQIDITGTVETGFLTHQIFLGGDYTKSHFGTSSINLAGVPAIDALNPVYLAAQPAAGPVRIGSHGTSELGSFAFQDIISITPEFDLTGGVRQSTYSAKRLNIANGVTSEIDTDNTSYQVGGTFHATDSIHFFAGYGEGFSPLPAVAMANGASLEPGESAQVEAGVKINFPSGLSGTASFFDITRSNVTTQDRFNPGFQVATGEIQSRGAEVELAYQVTEQWYVQGGYAFIDAEITQSNANDVGNRPEKIPEHQANIWTHYRFDSGVLKNLTLSAGANYVGNRPFDNANTAKLPNYTTLDLATSYTWKNIKLELFANNVLDKRYFVSADFGPAVFPGDPRTIFGRVSLKF
ncbi:TonB-dependent receptor [Methylobacter sp. BlB1]|uniref:TonB-dependent siderophore receptor n=1 Tax=Methylobacter sp. BlB1 TaxID=2785914 RepID=UPI0018944677|nr:TonB-dependent receptor [Methylobacter sp. BlB1]MBF6649911.1 TonB-dependent receptor [Methylobacter sp. BlB1]